MPSFFLSETLKYMYLLFDEYNFVHERAYIFSTEAHPFDAVQLNTLKKPAYEHFQNFSSNAMSLGSEVLMKKLRVLPNKCNKMQGWQDQMQSMYRPDYNNHIDQINDGTTKKKGMWYDNIPDLFDVTSTTSTSYKKRPRRSETCYGSAPENERHAAAGASEQKKTIQATIGDLGEFFIDITGDTFLIRSVADGNTLEISSVGRSTVYAHDFGDEKNMIKTTPGSVAGTLSGNTISCSVQVVPAFNSSLPPDLIIPLSFDILQPRDCAISVFGPTAELSSSLFENSDLNKDKKVTGVVNFHLEVSGDISLVRKDDENGCAAVPKTEATKPNKQWSPWSLLKGAVNFFENHIKKIFDKNYDISKNWSVNPETPAVPQPNKTEKKYSGKALVLVRGTCMFEEKAEYAQAMGAVAAVIINTEVRILLLLLQIVRILFNIVVYICRILFS